MYFLIRSATWPRPPPLYNARVLLHLHRPGPPLDRFVELVTYYAGFQPDHTKERLLPDGAIEIIVDLTDTPKMLYDRDDYTRGTGMRRAWISGMRRSWWTEDDARNWWQSRSSNWEFKRKRAFD